MTTGLWAKAGVPHKGWTAVDVFDLGYENYQICEMCEVREIRYVHVMEHINYKRLHVGCVCADYMDGTYSTEGNSLNKQAEDRVRKESARLDNFIMKGWKQNTLNSSRKLGKDKVSIAEDNNKYYWLVERDDYEQSNVYSGQPCNSEIEAKQQVWQMYIDEGWK